MKKYILTIVFASVFLIAATALAASLIEDRLELAMETSAAEEEARRESPAEILMKSRKINDRLMENVFEGNAENKSLLALQPPEIESIRILDADGKDCTVEGGWTTLSEKSKIKVILSGKATRVDFIIAPTGNESYLLQKVIGSSYPTGKTVEFPLDMPDDFMAGRLWLMVYNNKLARVSEEIHIISVKAAK